jgi:hypothetical protein
MYFLSSLILFSLKLICRFKMLYFNILNYFTEIDLSLKIKRHSVCIHLKQDKC